MAKLVAESHLFKRLSKCRRCKLKAKKVNLMRSK